MNKEKDLHNDLYNTAKELAIFGGTYSIEKRDNMIVDHKNGDPRDVVTNIDREIDKMLQQEILKKYPNHAICSEESESVSSDAEYTWSLDPIDGTSNYIRGIPHFATSISILKNNEMYIGAIYNPTTKECFTVDADSVPALNDTPIQVSEVTELKDAYVNFHPGRKEEHRQWAGDLKIALLNSAKKSLNLGASALDLCYIALGRMDILVYGTFNTLDVAGAIKVLRAAGGELYSYETKKPATILKEPQRVIATNNQDLLEDFFRQISG